MLEKYRPAVAALPLRSASYLRSRFHLNYRLQLHDALHEAGLDQAQVVLALLNAGHHDAVSLFVEIKHCPPQPYPWRNLLPAETYVPTVDERRVIRVLASDNPLTIPTARQRWDLLQRCRTVASYAARVPRWRAMRDLREWGRAGWLEVAA